jgi:hypothetical protein
MNMHVQPALARTAGPLRITPSAFDKCEPLPAGFRSINPDDAFDADRYFTATRCNGWGPKVIRDQGVVYYGQRGHPFDLQKDRTKLQKRRFAALTEWAAAKDPGESQRWVYLAAIVEKMPSGDFYIPLG